jgi:2,3-dimethylmalate lyase
MRTSGNVTRDLRQQIASGLVVAPGCQDVLSARLVEAAGFSAAYITGFGIAACTTGRPTIRVSLSQLIDVCGRIRQATSVPLIVNAEDGFGGPARVERTVRSLESVGCDAVHIEDREAPTTRGGGKDLVSMPVMMRKITAAKNAQRSSDFIVIARTDAAMHSVEEAIERGNSYAAAGADMVFVLMARFLPYAGSSASPEEVRAVYERFPNEIEAPLMTHSPHGLDISIHDAQAFGYRAYVMPQATLAPATGAMADALKALKEGRIEEYYGKRGPFSPTEILRASGLSDSDVRSNWKSLAGEGVEDE